jgi:hypothetical protein
MCVPQKAEADMTSREKLSEAPRDFVIASPSSKNLRSYHCSSLRFSSPKLHLFQSTGVVVFARRLIRTLVDELANDE